jgi:hypothetical protein
MKSKIFVGTTVGISCHLVTFDGISCQGVVIGEAISNGGKEREDII